ncbi:zinc finger protein 616-like [Periplaneta americana]|uniref:zinc finger protein 616-like n=1 Tax=Periplaneta americana TaxID=6978 RepID=UPI0037E7C743
MNLEMDTESRHVLETERVVIKDEAIESIFLSEIKTELEDYYEYERDGEPEYNPDAGENLIPCKLETDDSEISVSEDQIITGDSHIFDMQEDYIHKIKTQDSCSDKSELNDSSGTINNYCQTCNKQFRRHTAFLAHMKIHLLDEDDDVDDDCEYFVCDICNKEIKTKTGFEQHKEKHLRKLNECEFCGFKTYNIYEHNRHLLKHSTSDVLYKCRLCNFQTKCLNVKAEHLKVHELNVQKSSEIKEQQITVYHCRECNFQTKDINAKNEHTSKHELIHNETEISDIKCGDCSEVFTDLNQFFIHKKTHSEFKCRECVEILTRKTFKRFHRLLNTGELIYSCCSCKSEFAIKSSSKAHKNDKEQIYCRCDKCGKKFVLPSLMFAHRISHCAGKNINRNVREEAANMKLYYAKQGYKCTQCEKNYENIVEYTRHMVVHWKSDKFSQNNDQSMMSDKPRDVYQEVANIKRQYEKQGYNCKQCGKNCDNIVEYSRHMTIHWKSIDCVDDLVK